MKRASVFALLCALLLLLLAGCSHPDVTARLDRAEASVMVDANAALATLDSIPAGRLTARGDIARYHLVRTMALYRLNNLPPTDSLISLAVNRYEQTDDPYRLMQALFLRAVIRDNLKLYAPAMADAMMAHDIAQNFKDDDWIARTAECIADIFVHTKSYQEALPYINKVIDSYNNASKERNVLFSLCDKAEILERIDKNTESVQLLDSVYNIARQEPVDTVLLSYCIGELYPSLMAVNKKKRAIEVLREKEEVDELTSFESATLAYLLVSYNQLEQAKEYIIRAQESEGNNIDRVQINQALAAYYKASGQIDSLAQLHSKAIHAIREEVNETLNNSSITGIEYFYQEKNRKEALEKRQIKNYWIFYTILSLFIIALIIVLYRNKIRILNLEKTSYIAQIHAFSTKLSNITDSNAKTSQSLQNQIENLFREQWRTLNTICNRYFEGPDDEFTKNLVIQELKEQLKKIRDPKTILLIEESVNQNMDNIISLLREECPFLKESDLTLLTLSIAGFSSKTICLLLDIKLKNFYAKKSRLIEKILNAGTKSAELFERRLYK